MNDWQKNELKKTWGTLRRVLSSRSRKARVVELLRAWANLADDLPDAGYRPTESGRIKHQTEHYEDYLKHIANVIAQVQAGHADDTPEVLKKNPAMRALFNNLHMSGDSVAEQTARLDLAQKLDDTIRQVPQADWRGNPLKEKRIKRAMLPLLGEGEEEVGRLFRIIEQRDSGY